MGTSKQVDFWIVTGNSREGIQSVFHAVSEGPKQYMCDAIAYPHGDDVFITKFRYKNRRILKEDVLVAGIPNEMVKVATQVDRSWVAFREELRDAERKALRPIEDEYQKKLSDAKSVYAHQRWDFLQQCLNKLRGTVESE